MQKTRRLLLSLILIPTLAIILSQNQALSATSSVEFRLKGILISPTSRSAMVNGKIVGVGEHVDGIEILAIEEDAVLVLSGSEEYAVPVGSGARLLPSQTRSARSAPIESESRSVRRRVNSGDTLSGIAEDYAGAGLSLHQVMVALFEANPGAFDGNLNRLRAGAELSIPADMHRLDRNSALAEVMRQTESWRAPRERRAMAARIRGSVEVRRVGVATAHESSEYGPVRFGETLSEIAIKVSRKNVSMNEMMDALFEANPHAFGNSIDLLREGAVLRIPGFDDIDQTPTLAANSYR